MPAGHVVDLRGFCTFRKGRGDQGFYLGMGRRVLFANVFIRHEK